MLTQEEKSCKDIQEKVLEKMENITADKFQIEILTFKNTKDKLKIIKTTVENVFIHMHVKINHHLLSKECMKYLKIKLLNFNKILLEFLPKTIGEIDRQDQAN